MHFHEVVRDIVLCLESTSFSRLAMIKECLSMPTQITQTFQKEHRCLHNVFRLSWASSPLQFHCSCLPSTLCKTLAYWDMLRAFSKMQAHPTCKTRFWTVKRSILASSTQDSPSRCNAKSQLIVMALSSFLTTIMRQTSVIAGPNELEKKVHSKRRSCLLSAL